MKKSKFIFAIAFMVSILISLTYSSVNAATGYQGYAVYKDGTFLGYTWHAGIMQDTYSDVSYTPVIQHSGQGYAGPATWADFLGSGNFMGVFRPKVAPTSTDRSLFVGMARKLASEQISYNVAYEIWYDRSTTGAYVTASDISSMRCDGVVEYIYEYYGFRVFGDDANWNISVNSLSGREAHSMNVVTPDKQAGCLIKVTADATCPYDFKHDCLEFQKFYNNLTQTASPIAQDGIYGPATEAAYITIGALISGRY